MASVEFASDLGLLRDVDRVTDLSTRVVSMLMWCNYVKKRIRDEDPAEGSTFRVFAWLTLLVSIPISWMFAESSAAWVFVGSLMAWAPDYVALCCFDSVAVERGLQRRIYKAMAGVIVFGLAVVAAGHYVPRIDAESFELLRRVLLATSFAHLSLFVHMAVLPAERKMRYAGGAWLALLLCLRPVDTGRAPVAYSAIIYAMYLSAVLPNVAGRLWRRAALVLVPLGALPYALSLPGGWVWSSLSAVLWLVSYDSVLSDRIMRTPSATAYTEEESIPLLVPADSDVCQQV
eukprot:TRINITY_DN6082_c0_g1_i1.p1 TRINITY_DN6082_c0_g1~~TRINITY_DN6082_c0_g1_i1.p1  ORF type:complete len:289 (+),score=41.28 TRINITY_DN6082_c0_g1_i1:130-996(+)